MTKPIYLDYMATTPIDPRVVKAMLPYLGPIKRGLFGNPSSKHYFGMHAQTAVENARSSFAKAFNCEPSSIIWTSGATESNNLAIKGAANFYKHQGKHIITSKSEHKSVLDVYKYLENTGFRVTYLTPKPDGLIDLDSLKQAICQDTTLLSIHHVNSEIGTMNDIKAISKITQSKGVLLHVDAAQSAGKIPIDLQELQVDLMSFSGHKIYGPKGIGALYIRTKPQLHLAPIFQGGDQEQGIRPGTLATHQIIGMVAAINIAISEMQKEEKRLLELRELLWNGIKVLGNVYVNGSLSNRISTNLNISFGDIDGELLVAALKDIAISTSSACTRSIGEPSHVLKAIGVPNELIHNSIRLSIGRFTTKEQIKRTLKHITTVIKKLRA